MVSTKELQTVNMWDKEVETMPRAELQRLQVGRLKGQLRRVYEMVPFYRRRFDEKGIRPQDINSLDDLRHLPFTTKNDYRDNYPFDLLAVPQKDIVRVHGSSGTTGKPIAVGYTRNDVELWADLMARTEVTQGVTSDDVFQITFGYGLFTGGLGHHYGAERLGAAVVPAAAGLSRRQLMLMEDFGTTVLCGTPSYALTLADTAAELGIDFRRRMKLRLGVFGAETWSERLRDEIESRLGIQAMNNYGLAEVMGPGVSAECVCRCGMHIAEDHFLAEVIDPETEEPLDYGEVGELVLTTLTKEGLPVIRYRTRDRTSLNPEPCKCGRTMMRMGRVLGRTDDMVKVRGVNVFPSMIESVLLGMEGLTPHYMIVVDRDQKHVDGLEIRVEVTEELFRLGPERMKEVGHKAAVEFRQRMAVAANVRLVEPNGIPRSEGKAKRVVDLREL